MLDHQQIIKNQNCPHRHTLRFKKIIDFEEIFCLYRFIEPRTRFENERLRERMRVNNDWKEKVNKIKIKNFEKSNGERAIRLQSKSC